MMKRFALIFLLCGCVHASLLYAQDISIKTYFTPSTLAIGERGSFSIVGAGVSLPTTMTLPKVSGLQFGYVGKSHSIQITNGLKRTQVTHNYWVVANTEGTFVFPDTPITIDGKEYTIEGALLTVVAQKENTQLGNLSPTLSIHIGEDTPYVGEAIPVQVTLKAPDGVEGRVLPPNHPIQRGDNFMDYGFNTDPKAGSFIENNVHYKTYTWETAITPIKAGTEQLQYELPLALILTREQHRNISSIFDQQLNSMFGNFVREEREVLLKTKVINIGAVSLPQEGRPNSFTGAIGNFQVGDPQLSSINAEVGEPITLSFSVTGQGNFNSIQAPKLGDTDKFKSYTPKMNFQPKNVSETEGALDFEYIIIPQKPGVLEIKDLQFSFFNPKEKRYAEIPVAASAIQVSGTSLAKINNNTKTTSLPLTQTAKENLPQNNGLLPIKLEPSAFSNSLTPLSQSDWFYSLNGVVALACMSWVIFRRIQLKHNNDPTFHLRIEAQKNIEHHLKQAHLATESNQVELFLDSAQKALKQCLISTDSNINHDSITWSEMEPQVRNKINDIVLVHYIQNVFESADAIKYGQQSWDKKSIHDEYDKLKKCIQLLSKE